MRKVVPVADGVTCGADRAAFEGPEHGHDEPHVDFVVRQFRGRLTLVVFLGMTLAGSGD